MEGSKRYGCYMLDTMNPSNVDRDNTLVDLQAFGSYNMWVRLENLEDTLLEPETNRAAYINPAFAVIPSFRNYASLVNVNVQDSGASAVSRYHCQDTGRKVIKVHNIVPTYSENDIERSSCVTTDKTFRMIDDTCKPGLKKDEDQNCCRTFHKDLLEQLVILSAYRNVDFPPRLNYLKDILSWYSSVIPLPSIWTKEITLSIAKKLPLENAGLIDVISTLKPTIMNAVISVHVDKDESVGNLLRQLIKSLDVPNMHKLKLSLKPMKKEQHISDAIFEEVMNIGRYPMGNFQAIMSWDESRIDQIFTTCQTVLKKERFEMRLHYFSRFERNSSLTPQEMEEEDVEIDSSINNIKEKIEGAIRKAGYKGEITDDDEPEPYMKEHVEVQMISFWRNNKREDRIFELNFVCKSKLSFPKKF